MNEATLKDRVESLLAGGFDVKDHTRGHELFQGAVTLLTAVHGSNSTQVKSLVKEAEQIRQKYHAPNVSSWLAVATIGSLKNLQAELDAGLTGSLQRTITGEVLTDFIQLARTTLNEKGDAAKNVAAVLAASVYEDTIRRLAMTNGIPHIEKLSNVLTALKEKGLLQGSQVGIANSYLKFRNNALHADWDNVQREAVASVLGFVEQLLLRHF
jgi:hypothetical protein